MGNIALRWGCHGASGSRLGLAVVSFQALVLSHLRDLPAPGGWRSGLAPSKGKVVGGWVWLGSRGEGLV